MTNIPLMTRADLARLKELFDYFAERAAGCADKTCIVCTRHAQNRTEATEVFKEIEERIALLRGALQGVIEEPDAACAMASYGLDRDDDFVAGRKLRTWESVTL